MSTLTLSAVEVPVTDTPLPVVKAKRWSQRPDESYLEWQNRVDTHKVLNAKAMQAKRAKAKRETFDRAEAIMRKAEHDFYLAVNHPNAHVSRIDPNASFDQMNAAMSTRNAAIAKIEALHAVVQALPKRLVATKQGQDIIASLTEHFRPFSRCINKVNRPAWDVCGSRALENLRLFNQMRSASPAKVSNSEPIPTVQRTVRVPLFINTRWETSEIPANSPLLWQSELAEIHQATVTARYNGLAHTCESTAKPIAGVEIVPGKTASVRTPVTLYASSALGRADGVFSIYPRVQDTRTR